MADNHSTDERDEADQPQPVQPKKVDYRTKITSLTEKLEKRKLRFYTLSEEVFDVNQEYLSKSDELRGLREKYKSNNQTYIDNMAAAALNEAEYQFRKANSQESSSLVTNLALESNSDVERYRSDLKYALQKYQEARRVAKRMQSDFSRLSDTSRVQSLNFLAFCRYSQNSQANEMNKLSVSEELPSKKDLNLCRREFGKCATKSRRDLANFYKLKIHEFQREERNQMGKCRTAMERNLARMNGGGEVQESALLASNLDHHMQVNSLENRVAQKLVMETQALLRADAEARESSDDEGRPINRRRGSRSNPANVAASLFPQVLLAPTEPSFSAKMVASPLQSRGGRRVQSSSGKHHPPPGPVPSYAQPKRSQTPTAPTAEPGTKTSAHTSSSASKAVPPQYRAQLSELYHSKKKAASAVQELHAARRESVFDAKAFKGVPGPESPVIQNCLLDAGITDTATNSNLVQTETGEYVDQGQQLGDLMAQLCAAEGKFRQLNAIKEGLDLQLVKQAHFLAIIARDLQADIESRSKIAALRLAFPAPLTSSGAATKVQDRELTRAFAPPTTSGASRAAGKLTAGGPIGGKYRYRIDPSATTAAPFVPLSEIQESYEENENCIRKLLGATAEVLNVAI